PARLPGHGPLPLLGGGARRRLRLLPSLHALHLARGAGADVAVGVPGLRHRLPDVLLRLLGRRREHRAAAVRGDPGDGARPLIARLASPLPRPRRPRARDLVERDAARHQLRARGRRSGVTRGVLGARDPLPALAPDALRSGGGSGHRRALGGALPAPLGHPARPRLVQAGRLPSERAPLRRARPQGVPALAARDGRALRAPDERKPRLQCPRRGRARARAPLAAQTGRPDLRPDDLRRPVPAADHQRAGRRPGDRARRVPDRRSRLAPWHLPARGPVLALLAPLRGLRRALARRDDQSLRAAGRRRQDRLLADSEARARRARRPARTILRGLTRLARVPRRALILAACALLLAGCSGGKTVSPAPKTVEGKVPTTPQVKGDATAGKQVFETAGCKSCHTLKDAGATGTVGPNLDEAKPPLDLVVDRVTNGKGVMPSFSGQLSEKQIADVAAYVVKATQG